MSIKIKDIFMTNRYTENYFASVKEGEIIFKSWDQVKFYRVDSI